MNPKKTKGKQKINIKKIEKDEGRSVTFSKRLNGIYTKISELSILCGVEVAFIGYSCSGKPYTFGSPSFQAVAERFLNGDASSSSSSSLVMNAHKQAKIQELCKKYNRLVEELKVDEVKVKKAAALAETRVVNKDVWWKVDPNDVKDHEKAKKMMEKYQELYDKLCEQAASRIKRGHDENNNK
ncbi:F3M18.10 [Arabidopsis thaliana]|uniref:AGAMOUS-like 59 n=1 Tax=Arabidopsis thaliana TaxID=3702 RepID=Q9SGP4_ARATH|nr:AGAMOUS-like 59 [Arabidopsis thaliana]AAF16766.1 F3M18.10 [Arabidopsis thaliana]AEE30979.1 AGAMOUS-like 59 [Arabidopsis thaliana]|eukprot:NP_174168.1 AGAMOUS-like 59 [Arabidopsis thaliana]